MNELLNIAYLVLGLIFLVKGADFLVDSASRIAKCMGVSDLIIGLTIVAIGTSVPELAAAVAASFEGDSALIVGSVVGSNISNICLVLGIAAMYAVVGTSRIVLRRDGYIMLGVFLLFYLFVLLGRMELLAGILFLSLFLAYNSFLARVRNQLGDMNEFRGFVRYFVKFEYVREIGSGLENGALRFTPRKLSKNPGQAKWQMAKDIALVAVGIGMVILGAEWLVNGALGLASEMGINSGVIGLTAVAFGTSMPEIAVVFNAAKKKYDGLAIGNILGSCVANLLLVVGVSVIIGPIEFDWITTAFTVPFMIIAAAVLVIMMHRESLGRKEGALLLGLYVTFIVLLFGVFGASAA